MGKGKGQQFIIVNLSRNSGAYLVNKNTLTNEHTSLEVRNERRVVNHLFKQLKDLKITLRN